MLCRNGGCHFTGSITGQDGKYSDGVEVCPITIEQECCFFGEDCQLINIYIYIVSLCFDFSVVQCSIHKK